jgi:hypothetical protein
VRVGHAVEQQEERRPGQRIEYFVDRLAQRLGSDFGDDPLMNVAPGQRRKQSLVRGPDLDAKRLREVHDLAHATVMAPSRDVNHLNAVRWPAQARRDCMESGQIARIGHAEPARSNETAIVHAARGLRLGSV